MQIVIDMPDSTTKEMLENYESGSMFDEVLRGALKQAIILPKEPTIEHEQKINKSAMMHEIYMEGVNMGGEYQGCWVRFKEIEKIVDKYVR